MAAPASQIEIPAPREEIILRPVQERAVEAVRAELRRGRKSVLLVAPTGFGKTATTAVLIRRAVDNRKRVLFLVHRREIVRDTARRLVRAGVPCGIVMADEEAPADVPVLVCSVQTLAVRGHRPPADLLFWDEAHHCAARTYREIATSYPGVVHVGLTATPERADGTGLSDMFEVLVLGATVRELVGGGLLVPCDVVAPDARIDGLAWPVVDAWQKHAAGRRTVVFAKNVHHGTTLAAEFSAIGVAAACVHGGTPKKRRDQVLEDFAAGKITVLINVYCLTEGWDAPATEVCVLARGCGSAATFLQMVGRVLRTAPGKSRALLIDLFGVVHEHGLPDEEREFSLDGNPIRQKDKLPPLRTCDECGAVFRAKPKCPRCGYVFPPPPAPAVTNRGLARVAGVVPREDMLREWLLLCRAGKARGYLPGWAAYKFRDRFGFFPPRGFPKFHEVVS